MEMLTRGAEKIALHHHPIGDPADPETPLAIVFPAMGVPAGYYGPFAAHLNRAGFAVTVVDLRGTGASVPKPSRRSAYGLDDLVADVDAVLAAQRPGRPVLLVGHSLGGQACLLHLARRPGDPRVRGLALVAVGLPYWRDYGWRAPAVLGYTQLINLVSMLVGYWPGWTFGGAQSRPLLRDWAYTARHGRYPRREGFDGEAVPTAVRTPILAVSVEADGLTPPATVDRFAALAGAAAVVRVHYTAAQAGRALNHFSWVRASAPLVDRIGAWWRSLDAS